MTSIESFFAGGGGKSVSWKDKALGTSVTGTIKTVHRPQPRTDPVTNEPVINKATGQPKMQVRIDLATAERDPSDPEDDGSRGLYVQGWMQGAIGDALRKAGVQGGPQVGGQLTVQLVERTPNDNPALAPINKFAAWYVPPSPAAGFFGAPQDAAPQQPVAPPPGVPQYAPQPPQTVYQAPVPSMTPGAGYAVPPHTVPAPIQPPPGVPQYPAQQPVAPEAPPAAPQGVPAAVGAIVAKPAPISQEAWDSMDDAQKAQLAATMGDIPF